MTPASWEVERQQRIKAQSFKALVKELPITSMSIIEFKEQVEKIYVDIYLLED